jgi:hypothetical protein
MTILVSIYNNYYAEIIDNPPLLRAYDEKKIKLKV